MKMQRTEFSIEEIINVDTYPVIELNTPERHSLVQQYHAELQSNLFCTLPGFVTGPALKAMAQEAKSLQDFAYHNNALRNCYLHRQLDSELNVGHARNIQDRSSTRMIAYDQLYESSVLKTLYQHKVVRSFIADIVGEGELYDNEDQFQPANYVCYQDGDESSWHFDSDSSFTMTLMVQPAQYGGEFQMSPQSRTDDEQNYDHVAEVLRGEREDTVVSVGREPGALCIFKGCNSLHRVTQVSGEKLRIMGVFVYEFAPGIIGDPEVNATIYGPRVMAQE